MRVPARLLSTSTAAALALTLSAGVASAQTTTECVVDGAGSAVGEPAECPDDFQPDVLGEVETNPEDDPQPAPVPVTAPETLTATGVDSDVLALGALGAIALGGGAVWASRRRKAEPTEVA